jgi:hypothetical protein
MSILFIEPIAEWLCIRCGGIYFLTSAGLPIGEFLKQELVTRGFKRQNHQKDPRIDPSI